MCPRRSGANANMLSTSLSFGTSPPWSVIFSPACTQRESSASHESLYANKRNGCLKTVDSRPLYGPITGAAQVLGTYITSCSQSCNPRLPTANRGISREVYSDNTLFLVLFCKFHLQSTPTALLQTSLQVQDSHMG